MEHPDIRRITENLLADPAYRVDENEALALTKAADLEMIARWQDCSGAELISNNKI
ncbi:MAG: hypothetical protein KGY56_11105 [Desulfobacterales bacterium]|nr:hypothetical protein [Desulfobacterales bacterium]